MQKFIRIRGARVHNLKNVDVEIPLNKLVCFRGPSGSGKTSLAFHTLYSESKRRFINSFPSSFRLFIDKPTPAEVDEIFPVLPVFALPQHNPIMSSRSVVSDVMRLTEFLQTYCTQTAKEYCPYHPDEELKTLTLDEQLTLLLRKNPEGVCTLLVKTESLIHNLHADFPKTRSWQKDKKMMREWNEEDEYSEIFRFKLSSLESRVEERVNLFSQLNKLQLYTWQESQKAPQLWNFSSAVVCPKCDFQGVGPQSPQAFSPHTAVGACVNCKGYGAQLVWDPKKMFFPELSFEEEAFQCLRFSPLDWWKEEWMKFMKRKRWPLDAKLHDLPKEMWKIFENGEGSWEGYIKVKKYLETKKYKPAVRVFLRKMQSEERCQACKGSRLRGELENFWLNLGNHKVSVHGIFSETLESLRQIFKQPIKLQNHQSQKIHDTILHLLNLACDLGLGHLQINRKSKTLSAGEYQRLLLLKYLSYTGTDALFIFDEPSVGLGLNEQKKILQQCRELIKQGNSVILIDHSPFLQTSADFLVSLGPRAGAEGGEIQYVGSPTPLLERKIIQDGKSPSELTISDIELGLVDKKSKTINSKKIKLTSPSCFGKMYPDLEIPLNNLLWIRGPSGCGKSALFIHTLAQAIHRSFYLEDLVDEPGDYKKISGLNEISDILVVNSQLNRFTSRSSVGSITGLGPSVRKHFLQLPMVKAMGLEEGHFSANSVLGACPVCEGRGQRVIEMQFLEDIVLTCEECQGKKLKATYANISDGKRTVHQAFNQPLNEVLPSIKLTPKFKAVWEYLKILNLDYLSLERGLNSLSGGEKQRIYFLSKLLALKDNTLLILENLSFGLSDDDFHKILILLKNLVAAGHTVILIDSKSVPQNLEKLR